VVEGSGSIGAVFDWWHEWMAWAVGEVMITWRSNFDEFMADQGPPAVFTLDHRDRLGIDEARTREAWTRLGQGGAHEWCHCLFEDKATGWHQYALVTSAYLCEDHPRAFIHRFDSMGEALEKLSAMGSVPIRET
jgi:hypothetical protein